MYLYGGPKKDLCDSRIWSAAQPTKGAVTPVADTLLRRLGYCLPAPDNFMMHNSLCGPIREPRL
jgi:hypothetical protein